MVQVLQLLVGLVESIVALLAVPLDGAHPPRGEVDTGEEGYKAQNEKDEADSGHLRKGDVSARQCTLV